MIRAYMRHNTIKMSPETNYYYYCWQNNNELLSWDWPKNLWMTDSGIPLSAASFALGELWFMLGLLPADVHTSLCSLWKGGCMSCIYYWRRMFSQNESWLTHQPTTVSRRKRTALEGTLIWPFVLRVWQISPKTIPCPPLKSTPLIFARGNVPCTLNEPTPHHHQHHHTFETVPCSPTMLSRTITRHLHPLESPGHLLSRFTVKSLVLLVI